MSIQGPISSFAITAAGSGQTAFAGPARLLAVYYMNSEAQGTITIYDDTTEVLKIQIPDGSTTEISNYIELPGDGIKCNTSLKYTFATVAYGTLIFQEG